MWTLWTSTSRTATLVWFSPFLSLHPHTHYRCILRCITGLVLEPGRECLSQNQFFTSADYFVHIQITRNRFTRSLSPLWYFFSLLFSFSFPLILCSPSMLPPQTSLSLLFIFLIFSMEQVCNKNLTRVLFPFSLTHSRSLSLWLSSMWLISKNRIVSIDENL